VKIEGNEKFSFQCQAKVMLLCKSHSAQHRPVFPSGPVPTPYVSCRTSGTVL